MASLVRPWVVSYVLPGGKHVRKGTAGARKKKGRTRKWYGQGVPGFPGKRFPLATDRGVAQRMLDDLVRRAERGRAGMPTDEPLGPLLDEWALTIGGEATHIREVTNHARAVLAAIGVQTLSGLRGRGLAGRVETYLRGTLAGDSPLAGRTAAAYGAHTRQFTRWLWRKRELLDADPLAGLDLPSQEPERPRRDLTPDELRMLLEAAAKSVTRVKHLSGPDRAILYLVAAATGYRAGELAALTPPAFRLDREPPTVFLAGRYTKDGQDAEQPIPDPLANRLKPYIAPISRSARVWGGNWFKKAADLLRVDLAAAGILARTEAGDAVFHSLRHTYATMLAGVAPVKVAQELVRHADPALTIGRYAHASDAAKALAVNAMPLPLEAQGQPAQGFDGLSRSELEDVAAGLWLALATILGGKR